MSSIRDVAVDAGVSLGTVSKFLNAPERCKEKTRQRVQGAIDRLGYVRNASAHQLRAGRSPFIGLVVLDVTNPFFTEVARGAEDVAHAAGAVVILGNSDDSLEKEQRYLRTLEEQRAQAVLIAPVQTDLSHLLRLQNKGMALVLLGPTHAGVCSVAVDDVHGGELAGTHLFAQGHTQVVYMHGPLSLRPCLERGLGLQRAAIKAGRDPLKAILDCPTGAQSVHEGEQAFERLVASSECPTAIFCANDLLAVGVMRSAAKRHLAIPQDIALVGYDDIDLAESLTPALTTVRQPKYELGQAATELALDEMLHPTAHKHRQILYQPELIVRESSVNLRVVASEAGVYPPPSYVLVAEQYEE